MAINTEKTLADWQAIYDYWLANQGAQQDLPINPATGSGTAPPAPAVQPTSGAEKIGLGGEMSVMGGYGSGYNINSPEYRAWMEAQAKAGAKPAELDPSKMTAEEFAAARPPWNVTTTGPHPSSTDPRDMNGDGTPDAPPPGLTGLPPSTTTPPTASGPADTLPGNPGIDQTDANNNGTPDIYEQGPGSPGYTGSKPAAPKVDRDGNGIDDREQTTVGGTGPFGPNYADMWAQTLAANPQMGYGGNGQMGWGGAMTTGTGPVIGGGGDSGLGGYGTTGGGSGGNFSLPGGATGTGTGGFQMPDFNPPAFTDVSGIGTTTSGTGSPSTGGTGGTGFQFPDFQTPGTTTGTTTGTTSPLAGYGSAPSTGTPNAGLVQNLAGSYQQQIDAANASNESRYGTGLEMLLKRYEQAGNAMLGLTNEGIADIGRLYERQRASMDQGLIDRGLANTTVRSAIDRGYTTDQAQAERRYWDDQARKNLDEQFRQTGAITDWIGGRNDVAPSTGDLANLASGVGSAGPGATTTTGTPSTTTSTATPAPVNLPPQVTTALQNGTLGSLAATQPGVNPAGTTPSSGFLNQGANITTPEQLSSAVNGGGTTRAQTPAPPPPSSPLAGYGDTAASFPPPPAQSSGNNGTATTKKPEPTAPMWNVDMTMPIDQKYLDPNSTASTDDFWAMQEAALKASEARGLGRPESFRPPPYQPPAPSPTPNLDGLDMRSYLSDTPGVFGPNRNYGKPIEKQPTPGSTDYKLPTQQPFMGGGNANNGKTGMDAQYAPGMMSANSGGFSAAPSMPKPPPPSSPSVMGFPGPQGTGVAPGNPNDVMNAMRAQNPNNPQLSSGFRAPDTANPSYGGTPGMASMSSPLAGYGREPNTPKQANPSTTSYGSGFGQSFTMPSAPATPNPGVVPQRPEPVPFNTAATPPASPLSGYGTTPPGMPSFMALPGPTPAPTFQQMGGPGTQYKPPSLVGGVMMPQPPARRYGV